MEYEEYKALKKQTKAFSYGPAEANDWYRELELAMDTVKRLIHSGYDNPLMVKTFKDKFPEPPAVIMSFLARQLSVLSYQIIGEARIYNDWPKMPKWGAPPETGIPEEADQPNDVGC